ncbi:MAG: zf-TFIIB domain-containing protein [Oligoflexales bacterium]|nr:zf-TFIIB domain-containing protein [Oligoflexales bacterium]
MQQQLLKCPRCPGAMQTHNRNGIHIEQCNSCRGIFLDFGELETLTQLQMQWMQQMAPQTPPAQFNQPLQPNPPAWASHQHGQGHGHHYKKKGFMRMLFSS